MKRLFCFPSRLLAPFHFRYSYLHIKFQRVSLSRFGALACDMGIFEICLLKYFLQFYPQRLTFGTAGSHPGGLHPVNIGAR